MTKTLGAKSCADAVWGTRPSNARLQKASSLRQSHEALNVVSRNISKPSRDSSPVVNE